MNYLAIDAATEACSVALMKKPSAQSSNIISQFELCPQSHSLVLLPMVDAVLKEANVTLAEIEGLFYGRGPGSFTGVRIGIGVAQGLAFSANLPTVGISTMQTMAQQAFEQLGEKQVCVAIDARMSEVYTGIFNVNDQGLMVLSGEEQVLPPEQLVAQFSQQNHSAMYGVGTGWQSYQQQLSPLKINQEVEILYPDARYMLAQGELELAQGKGLPAEQAQPVYVRDTVSWKKLPGRE